MNRLSPWTLDQCDTLQSRWLQFSPIYGCFENSPRSIKWLRKPTTDLAWVIATLPIGRALKESAFTGRFFNVPASRPGIGVFQKLPKTCRMDGLVMPCDIGVYKGDDLLYTPRFGRGRIVSYNGTGLSCASDDRQTRNNDNEATMQNTLRKAKTTWTRRSIYFVRPMHAGNNAVDKAGATTDRDCALGKKNRRLTAYNFKKSTARSLDEIWASVFSVNKE